MWTQTYSKKVQGIDKKNLWSVWTDINNWNQWLEDVEYAKLKTSFCKDAKFEFKPKGGPKLELELTEVIELQKFVDLTRFPFAQMYDSHELIELDDGIEIKSTIKISGPLSFIWRKIVGEDIAKSFESQTNALISRTQNLANE